MSFIIFAGFQMTLGDPDWTFQSVISKTLNFQLSGFLMALLSLMELEEDPIPELDDGKSEMSRRNDHDDGVLNITTSTRVMSK